VGHAPLIYVHWAWTKFNLVCLRFIRKHEPEQVGPKTLLLGGQYVRSCTISLLRYGTKLNMTWWSPDFVRASSGCAGRTWGRGMAAAAEFAVWTAAAASSSSESPALLRRRASLLPKETCLFCKHINNPIKKTCSDYKTIIISSFLVKKLPREDFLQFIYERSLQIKTVRTASR
jgi:hypothetical protein